MIPFNFDLDVPEAVMALLSVLSAHGFEAYLAGGCVRDSLMGRAPRDWDVATSASPDQAAALFPAHDVIGTGIKHGTIMVLMHGEAMEVTTFRGPAGSLEDDLSRRDLTVNAMAWGPERGLVDPFDGAGDIRRGLIRATGDPDARFREDGLRVLRALRFASAFGWSIEADTAAAIHRDRELLLGVAPERIQVELTQMLCGPGVCPLLLEYGDVLAVPMPELTPLFGFDQRNPHHLMELWGHTAAVVNAAPPEPVLRWAALLHDIGKPDRFTLDEEGIGYFYGHAPRSAEIAEDVMERLRFDNATSQRATLLVARHEDLPWGSVPHMRRTIRRMMSAHGPEATAQLIALRRADMAGHAPEPEALAACGRAEDLLHELQEEGACLTLRDMAVRGGDLLGMGYEGRALGAALAFLLEAVVDERVPNEREALMSYLREHGEGPRGRSTCQSGGPQDTGAGPSRSAGTS